MTQVVAVRKLAGYEPNESSVLRFKSRHRVEQDKAVMGYLEKSLMTVDVRGPIYKMIANNLGYNNIRSSNDSYGKSGDEKMTSNKIKMIGIALAGGLAATIGTYAALNSLGGGAKPQASPSNGGPIAPDTAGNVPANVTENFSVKGADSVMMNVVTWETENGYKDIDWNKVTTIDIFHVEPRPDGSVHYDGGLPNLDEIIKTAKAKGKDVKFGFGGWFEPEENPKLLATYKKILNDPKFRENVTSSLIDLAKKKGYVGMEWDWEMEEKHLAGADGVYNATKMSDTINYVSSRMKAEIPGFQFDIAIDDWLFGTVDMKKIYPHVDHVNYMFSPSEAEIRSLALRMGGSDQKEALNKIAVGFNLNDETPESLEAKLKKVYDFDVNGNGKKDNGDGLDTFYFEAGLAKPFYKVMKDVQ